MSIITKDHFGGNVILTRDNLENGSAYGETLKEIDFHNIRFPGGGVTEAQTWENGGLQKMFGEPMDPEAEGYVLTIRETLIYAAESEQSISIVIPTFQFYESNTDHFDARGFKAYIGELQKALSEHPAVTISSFEIGNEYWGSKEWGGLEPSDYGKIANSQIPLIKEMIDEVWQQSEDQPTIGIQAGVQWKAEQNPDGTWTAVGPLHSAQIIDEISLENRGHIGAVFQHSYPDAENIDKSVNWAIRPMDVFKDADGFPETLKLILSEFNIGQNTAVGVEQGAAWIDAFSKFIDSGITNIDHWGISYEWLSNKFYDTKFPSAEGDNGTVAAIATPMGQLYDIAERHIIGATTASDNDVLKWVSQSSDLDVTGFEKPGQTVAFYYNSSKSDAQIYLSGISEEFHVSTFHIIAADSLYSDWYDESISQPLGIGKIADARGDMKVVSGGGGTSDYDVKSNEIVVVVISDSNRDLFIEGAHNVTDPRTGVIDDVIEGARGNDVLLGHIGNDRVYGGDGKNVISGGKGADLLIAGKDGDVIFSDGGNDTVKGGIGDDVVLLSSSMGHLVSNVSGSGGQDLFMFSENVSVSISDFSKGDYLSFGGVFKNASEFKELIFIDNKDIVIYTSAGGSITLENSAHLYRNVFDQVIDFRSIARQSELINEYFTGMSDFQIKEIFSRAEENQGAGNWLPKDLKQTLNSIGGVASDLDDHFVPPPISRKVLIGTDGPDKIVGNSLDNIIEAKIGADIVYAGSGNDSIFSDAGDDVTYGGDGNDTIHGDSGKDQIHGGKGSDILFGGSEGDAIYGNVGDDVISGGLGDDLLFGGLDNDKLFGGVGSDRIFGGLGGDKILGHHGDDYLHGGWGNDVIYGGFGGDTLNGGVGNDTLKGGIGNDNLFGSAGNDWLNGAAGNDTVNGGTGFDWVSFQGERLEARVDLAITGSQATGHGLDVILNIENIHGGAGNDILLGNAQANLIRGGFGADRLFGQRGSDTVEGNAGVDFLDGGQGSDVLLGGNGNDQLKGGAGSDVFVFRNGFDRDVILDFQNNIDTIRLLDFGVANFAEARAFATQSGSNVVFDFDDGDILIVRNTTISVLADDLLFV